MKRWANAGVFLACAPVANAIVAAFGVLVTPLGVIPWGTPIATVAFVSRDRFQDDFPRWWSVLGVIVTGAAISALFAPALAAASGVAFLVSELLNWAIYTPLRLRNRRRAVIVSSCAGGALDSILFLWIAFGTPAGWVALALAKSVLVIGYASLMRPD